MVVALALAAAPAWAQTSTGFKLQEASFNNTGAPTSAGALASPSFHASLTAMGDAAVRPGLVGASFKMAGGFVGAYAPPAEATGLRFTNQTMLQWNTDPPAQSYGVYRGLTTMLPGVFGTCLADGSAAPTTPTISDTTVPPLGGAFFYFVTSHSPVEEGTKGYRSNGVQRTNPFPCHF